MTDKELLQQYVREGSEAAFGELVHRHLGLVYSAAQRQCESGAHSAADVSQVVFIELARQAPKLIHHPSLRGWLYVCTRHMAAKLARTERRRAVRETAAHAMNETAPPSSPGWDDIRPILDEVLCQLKARDRDAIFLRYFDRLSYAELGARLGITETAARRRADRGLDRVRALLARRGMTSSTSVLSAGLSTELIKASPVELASRITRAAMGAVPHAPAGVATLFVIAKSVVLSGTFIAALALSGVIAGGFGIYYSAALKRRESLRRGNAGAVAAAEARLAEIKSQMALSTSMTGSKASAISGGAVRNLSGNEAAIARDLELNRLASEQNIANGLLLYGAFFRAHGISPETQRQLAAAFVKLSGEYADLQEIAKLAGTTIRNDADLLAQARDLGTQWKATLAGYMSDEIANAMDAYGKSLAPPGQNGAGEARWVATQVAGVAFADGTPMTADQRDALTGLLLKYAPHYDPGQSQDPETLNWPGILAEAQQNLPAQELSALQSFQSAAAVWALERQARAAAKPTP